MYPFPGGFLRNASRVDAEAPDLDAHPAFATVPRWETLLRPSEMLFMPARLWHHVRAETASLSVSHWWGGDDRARRLFVARCVDTIPCD